MSAVPLPRSASDNTSVFGLSPIFPNDDPVLSQYIQNSFFIIRLTPKLMKANENSGNTKLLSPRKVTSTDHTQIIQYIRESTGYRPPFVFAIQQRSFTETYDNSYGESFYSQQGSAFQSDSTSYLASRRQMFGASQAIDLTKEAGAEDGKGEDKGLIKAAQGKLSEWLKDSAEKKSIGGMVSGMLQGGKVDLPKLWQSSSWGFDSTVQIKLFSPTASKDDVMEWVIIPIFILRCLAAPISEDGGDIYFQPPWVHIQFPTLLDDKLTGLKSMQIEWGGDKGAFTPDQLPLAANVNLVFEPIRHVVPTIISYPAKKTSSILGQYGLGAFADMAAAMGVPVGAAKLKEQADDQANTVSQYADFPNTAKRIEDFETLWPTVSAKKTKIEEIHETGLDGTPSSRESTDSTASSVPINSDRPGPTRKSPVSLAQAKQSYNGLKGLGE